LKEILTAVHLWDSFYEFKRILIFMYQIIYCIRGKKKKRASEMVFNDFRKIRLVNVVDE
jgi:hypothetical protein